MHMRRAAMVVGLCLSSVLAGAEPAADQPVRDYALEKALRLGVTQTCKEYAEAIQAAAPCDFATGGKLQKLGSQLAALKAHVGWVRVAVGQAAFPSVFQEYWATVAELIQVMIQGVQQGKAKCGR
jgi:hypothetical protein